MIINLNNGSEYSKWEEAKKVENTTHMVMVRDKQNPEWIYIVGSRYAVNKYVESIKDKPITTFNHITIRKFDLSLYS